MGTCIRRLKMQVQCLDGQISAGKTNAVKATAGTIISSSKGLLTELEAMKEEDLKPEWKLEVKETLSKASDAEAAIGAIATHTSDEIPHTKERSEDTMKLERLKLAVFSGDYREWKSWYEAFVLNVHENTKYNAQAKFSHLKKALAGEALQKVSHLTVTSENYKVALNILVGEYNNPQLTVAAYRRELEELEPATECFKDQYAKFDVISSVLANIQTLKTEESEDDL